MAFPLEKTGLAFLRFHLNVGVRLAAKSLAPFLAFFFAAIYLFKIEFLLALAQAVFVDSHFIISGLLYTVLTVIASRIVAPRIYLGLNGWIRHLPIKGHLYRRLALLSVFVALGPVLLALAVPSLLLAVNLKINPAVYFSGLPVLGLAAALYVLPVERERLIRPILLASCILSASGSWIGVIIGFLLFLICDGLAGPLSAATKQKNLKQSKKGLWLNAFISWRAVKWRMAFPFIFSFSFLGLAQVFVANNDPDPELSSRIYLLGGACCAVFMCAFLAHVLTVRRPPWPWARSLPWSPRQRVLMDAGFLALSVVPLFLMTILIEGQTLLPLLLSLPSLCLLSVKSMLCAFDLRTGAYGTVIVYGAIGSLLLCLYPLVSIVYVLLSPILLKQAVEQERLLKVSQWLERHHLAAGDSLSWSQK